MDDNSSKKINVICLDYVIKRILNYRQKNDVFVMESFLNAVLKYFNYKTVKIDRLHDKESLRLEKKNKKSITDFSAIDEDGRTYIVEVERFPKSVLVQKPCLMYRPLSSTVTQLEKNLTLKRYFMLLLCLEELRDSRLHRKANS